MTPVVTPETITSLFPIASAPGPTNAGLNTAAVNPQTNRQIVLKTGEIVPI